MIDVNTIKRWWQVFVGENNFTEVRILGRYQYSGYFQSLDNLIAAIEPYSNMDDEQIYFVLNKIDDACYGRQQCERIVKSPKITTNDNDIVQRCWVLCDFDPVRKSGTNASDEQLELARKKAQEVFRFLRQKGFSDPVVCKSGNGWHNLYKIDTIVNEETTEIIKGFFKYMGEQFSDEKVDFDVKNYNNARLCKLYGTMAKKGANIASTPWRMSEIIYVPKEIQTTPIEKFKELADLAPQEEPKSSPNHNNVYNPNSFNLVAWLDQHGIVYKEEKQGNSTKYTLEYCPWVDTHSDKKKWDSALFVDQNGKITFNCQHSHCKGKTWHDFRVVYEPDAYNKPQFQYTNRQYYNSPQKPKYQIKEEIPELGGKWLCMSDIEKIDLTQLESVKTGFEELDKAIVGLNMSEVTLLSGSNASGKSSWLNTLLLNVINQDYKVALWSGELRADILKAWIQMVAAGRNHLTKSQFAQDKYYVSQMVGDKIDTWLDGKFFLYNNAYGCEWEQVFHDMKELLKAGVKVFALDNLFSLGIDGFEGDKNNKQKELILQIKDFAMKNKVHIILVAHPRKVMTFLRKNDISGTSDLTNAVDNVFIIHRTNNDFFRAGAEFFGQSEINRFRDFGNVIEVAKNRLYGIVDFMVGMYYEIESRRFLNTQYEEKKYGWEETFEQSSIAYDTPPQVTPQAPPQVIDDDYDFTPRYDSPF